MGTQGVEESSWQYRRKQYHICVPVPTSWCQPGCFACVVVFYRYSIYSSGTYKVHAKSASNEHANMTSKTLLPVLPKVRAF